MPPRRKSALEDLIRQGLVADGELLRYKSKQGQVMAIGRAREGGIEVEGKSKLLGYTAFEDVAGSKYHRPAEHTHTTASRNLQGLALLAAGEGGGSAGGRSRKDADEEPAVELLEDENDDLCHVCGLGGDLMCCETCPAVFHAACLGLAAPPAGDFFCPMCICSVCGNGRSEGVMPTGCQWVDCQNFAGTEALQQLSRPHIGPPGDTGSQGPGSTAHAGAAPPAADAAAVKVESTEVLEAAGSAGAAGAEPMQVDAAGEAGAPADVAAGASAEGAAGYPAADFSQLVAAASAQWQATHAPADAAQASVARQAIAASASENAAVPCPVTLRWAHLRCFPPEFIQQLRQGTSQPCISSAEAAATSTRLAVVCSAGLLPLGSIPEGTRAESGGAAGVDARAPLPLSLLVVRGAAAAAPGDCRGYAPAYSAEQRQQVQVALSAALQLLHSCYAPIPDSRTGADILPWLLRGAVLANGEADFSGMHTALLYAGSALVAVAAFRSFGEFAELPVLAVRPELQRRNALGRLLLAAVEQLLLQAGSQWLLMPGFTADGQPFLPAHLAPAQAAPGLQQVQQVPQEPSALLQAKWGYCLAAAEQALAASSHPLVRLPGVLFACKQLSPGSVLPPPRLPRRLQWSSVGDPRQLLREGLLASVAAAPGAAELAAAAAAAAARQAAQSKPRPVGRPPKAPPPAAAAPAVKAEAQQHAVPAPTPEQQQLLALMYQQQILAQQAVAQTIVPGQPVSQQQLMRLYQQQHEQQEAFMQQLKQQYPETYFQQLQQLQLQQQAGQAHLLQQQAAAQQQAVATEAQQKQMQQAEHQGQ